MFTANSEEMVSNIAAMYASLSGETNEAALQEIKRLASEEVAHDHWLQTNKLSYESRLFLCAAVSLALRAMKNSPYKCAVFTRNMAESLHAHA
jgi:hypothetical protein